MFCHWNVNLESIQKWKFTEISLLHLFLIQSVYVELSQDYHARGLFNFQIFRTKNNSLSSSRWTRDQSMWGFVKILWSFKIKQNVCSSQSEGTVLQNLSQILDIFLQLHLKYFLLAMSQILFKLSMIYLCIIVM